MRFFYSFGIVVYGLGIRIASLFHPKARQWIQGRRGVFGELQKAMASGESEKQRTVWFHCASLGEFEQGQPVMEQFRELYPRYRLIVSFFSPSGYLPRKSYPGADGVFYLPLDTPANASQWIHAMNPSLVFFIKYEYWFNYLRELKKRRIPVFILSARFHANQPFFRWYGAWFRRQLDMVSWFFLQDEEAKKWIESIRINRYTITGDTRFDRVIATKNEQPAFPVMDLFKGEGYILTGGSTWEAEEDVLAGMINEGIPRLKYIIAPHEVHPERIAALEQRLSALFRSDPTLTPSPGSGQSSPFAGHHAPVIRFSALTSENAAAAQVVIVDSIGILARLYRYSSFALIGGGFGTSGLHNILEATAFGTPVFCGPNYDRFAEARELINLGGAFPVRTTNELMQQINRLIENPEHYHQVSALCRRFIENGQGATRRIIQGIQTLGFIAPPGHNPGR